MKELNYKLGSVAKGSTKKQVGGKLKNSRKKNNRPYSRKLDDLTDDEDRCEDDRMIMLLKSGVSADEIDRLYCVEGMSAEDVEHQLGSFMEPNAL